MQRCGSAMLTNCFSSHPQLCCRGLSRHEATLHTVGVHPASSDVNTMCLVPFLSFGRSVSLPATQCQNSQEVVLPMVCEKAKCLSEASSQLSAWVSFLKLVSRSSLVPDPSKHNAQNHPPPTPLIFQGGNTVSPHDWGDLCYCSIH